MAKHIALLAVLIHCVPIVVQTAEEVRPLYFSLILSFGQHGFNSSGFVPAIDLALKYVNDRPNFLSGYNLSYLHVRDSECHRGRSLESFFKDVDVDEPTKIAVVGCGCSVATTPVAEISHFWSLSQIAPASSSSVLGNRERFKQFFRTEANGETRVPAFMSLLQHFGWNQVTFITQKTVGFTELFSDIRDLADSLSKGNPSVCCLRPENYTLISQEFDTGSDPNIALSNLLKLEPDHRVFVINSYSGPARRIICEAFLRNLTYPHYVWITHGWWPENWWVSEVNDDITALGCTNEKLADFLVTGRVIAFNHISPLDKVEETDVTLNSADFEEQYKIKAEEGNYSPSDGFAQGFDAIWALAFALNNTITMISNPNRNTVEETDCGLLNKTGSLVPLHMFNYSNELMGCIIKWNLQRTNFTGVTGQIEFEEDGDPKLARVWMQQYRMIGEGTNARIKADYFGYSSPNSNYSLVFLEGESNESVFGELIPPDGTPEEQIHTYNIILMVAYYSLASVGNILAGVCLVLNFVFRKRKVIKLTSPNLNYLIAGGTLLMFTSVYFQLIRSTDSSIVYMRCIAHSWLYLTGYLLAFGTVLSKIWRVYHIFRDPTPKKKALHDWHLVVIVMVITGVGFLILILRSVLQPAHPVLVRDKEDSESTTSLQIRILRFVWECSEPFSRTFYCELIIFAYLGVLQIAGLILAFQTRKVKISVLNDSTFVAALVYCSSVIFMALLIVTFAPISGYIHIRAAVFSGGILLLAFISLALIFIPKMVFLYRDPHGKNIFEKTAPTTESVPTVTVSSSECTETGKLEERVATMERKICELEDVIQYKDTFISDLNQEIENLKQTK